MVHQADHDSHPIKIRTEPLFRGASQEIDEATLNMAFHAFLGYAESVDADCRESSESASVVPYRGGNGALRDGDVQAPTCDLLIDPREDGAGWNLDKKFAAKFHQESHRVGPSHLAGDVPGQIETDCPGPGDDTWTDIPYVRDRGHAILKSG